MAAGVSHGMQFDELLTLFNELYPRRAFLRREEAADWLCFKDVESVDAKVKENKLRSVLNKDGKKLFPKPDLLNYYLTD